MVYQIAKGQSRQLGVRAVKEGIEFCFQTSKKAECAILIYETKVKKIKIPNNWLTGEINCVILRQLPDMVFEYNFEIDGVIVPDPCAKVYNGAKTFASDEERRDLRSVYFPEQIEDYLQEEIEYSSNLSETILYKLNLRGFTMGDKGKGKHGTFQALTEKIPYLNGLGINAILLMPVYEFNEIIPNKVLEQREGVPKINLWGYGEGYYFAPKSSFTQGTSPVEEFKECIQALHQHGISCYLEFDFSKEESIFTIIDVLRYWKLTYQIDGFHLIGTEREAELILSDPFLKESVFFMQQHLQNDHFLPYCDEFFYPVRKMQNTGLTNMQELLSAMFPNELKLNYLADQNGFTLYDLFSYEQKHNEANGEYNLDGSDYNFSTNCGVEGETKKRGILELRYQKIKNALIMLYFSHGVPMLFSGDESGNTQQGNNNAYCQDNLVGWVDQKQTTASKQLLQFTSELISFRKRHDILNQSTPYLMKDTKSCGYPDLSFHGENAWITFGIEMRQSIGILFGGEYGFTNKDYIYLAMNFSNQMKKLALPKLPGKKQWYLEIDTSQKESFVTSEIITTKEITVPAGIFLVLTGR
ncbi:MAG: hypothetical protein ACK5ML_01410 [Lachnospiraceae bacterium]